MKFNELTNEIKAIMEDENVRWFNGITTKDLKEVLESEKGIKCSIQVTFLFTSINI
jgi:argonaute-like protein implicated in RNA metabolism and viral defense